MQIWEGACFHRAARRGFPVRISAILPAQPPAGNADGRSLASLDLRKRQLVTCARLVRNVASFESNERNSRAAELRLDGLARTKYPGAGVC